MYWFFGCFISSNFKSTTKLICLTRQIYKNVLARFSSIVDHFLVYDIGRLNNKKQSVILWRWGWGSQECNFANGLLEWLLYKII